MKNRLLPGSLCVLVCLVLFAQGVFSQESVPSASAYGIKKVDPPSFKGYPQVFSWISAGTKSSIVFTKDSYEDETSDTEILSSFTMNRSGKVGQINELLVVENGWLGAAQAFWVDGAAPADVGTGLLFIAYRPGGLTNTIIFAKARFDEEGKLIGGFEPFLELNLPEGDDYYSGIWLTAAMRDGVIGVVMAANIRAYNPNFSGARYAELYLAEFSTEGVLLSTDLPKVKLPVVGDAIVLQPFTPAWNGESWMVPVVLTINKEETYEGNKYTDEIGYQLYVLRAKPKKPGGPFKTKFRKSAGDNRNIHWPTYVSPVFLPAVSEAESPAASSAETLNLLYVHAVPAGNEGRGINAKKYSYYLQPINAKGRNSGKALNVAATKWNRKFAGTPGLSSEDTYCYFSNAYVTPDNRIALTHTRSAAFYKASDSSGKYELQLDYCIIDPADGKMTELAQSGYTNQFARAGAKILVFGKKPRSLSVFRQETAGKQTSHLYFSKLPK